MDPDAIIRRLELQPHPEGGHYKESYRDPAADGGRGACTHIYYLLKAGEASHWHRIDATEIWHWYGGAPLALSISADGGTVATTTLGLDLDAGQRPMAVVPARHWQAAESTGAWSLAGCTVAPAFDFAGFELAPPGWAPGGGGA